MAGQSGFYIACGALGAALLLAASLSPLCARLRAPQSLLVLGGATASAALVPQAQLRPGRGVSEVVSVALVAVLFHGGLHLGWGEVRSLGRPVLALGVGGTVLTAAAGAAFAALIIGLAWYQALLVGVALAPTDPAVVFSLLGGRGLTGEAVTVLEAESGANDPVGVALMAALLAAGSVGWSPAGHALAIFVRQMALGGLIGGGAGLAARQLWRAHPLSPEVLEPLRNLALAALVFGAAAAAGGSGFLAVFVAGLVLGDRSLPGWVGTERFHAALASLGELVAFAALGLSIPVAQLAQAQLWAEGLAVWAALNLLARPAVTWVCLIGTDLAWRQKRLVASAGLKGAVPILLGSYVAASQVPDAGRLYGLVVVVVVYSVSAGAAVVERLAS